MTLKHPHVHAIDLNNIVVNIRMIQFQNFLLLVSQMLLYITYDEKLF